MRRVLAIATLVAMILALLPAITSLPGGVAQGATITATCDGVQDATQEINPKIAAASDGDVIEIDHPPGAYCDIDASVMVVHSVTIRPKPPLTQANFKGPQIASIMSNVASARSAGSAKIAAAKAKAAQAQSAGAQTRGSGTGGGGGANAKWQGGGRDPENGAPTDDAPSPGELRSKGLQIQQHVISRASSSGGVGVRSTTTGPGIIVFGGLPGTVDINHITIEGFDDSDTDGAGGGIFVGFDTRISLADNVIKFNKASRGGGIAMAGNNDGSQLLRNTIAQNIADSGVCGGDSGDGCRSGGGLWMYFDADNVTIEGNTFDANVAVDSGGGLWFGFQNDRVSLNRNNCLTNQAGKRGGCLRTATDNRDLVFGANQINGNTSGWGGGGISLAARSGNPTFNSNSFNANVGTWSGGAVRIGSGIRHSTWTNNQFNGNSTTFGRGGAVRLHDGNSTCGLPTTFTGNTFKNNSAGTSLLEGGALQVGTDNPCLTFSGNTWEGNAAPGRGGAISFNGGDRGGSDFRCCFATSERSQDVIFDNEQFKSNTAGSSASDGHGGGAIFFGDEMPGLQIRNNTLFQGNRAALDGGAIHFASDSDDSCCGTDSQMSRRVTIKSTQFVNNNSTSTNGGAIAFAQSMPNLQILDSMFDGNGATSTSGGGLGGGVAFATNPICCMTSVSPDVTVKNTQFLNNQSFNDGGAVYINQRVDRLVVDASTFQGNKSLGSNGGAISFEYGDTGSPSQNATIKNSTFQNNTANNSGGAVSLEGANVSSRITANRFSGNTASTGNGGALVITGTTSGAQQSEVDHNDFQLNKANGTGGNAGGGAIHAYSNNGLRIWANTIKSNTATRNGGGVLLGSAPDAAELGMVLEKNWISANSAANGGGLAVQGDINPLRVVNNVVVRNTVAAGGNGGNVRFDATVTITDEQFYNNTVANGAVGPGGSTGGVYVNQTVGGSLAFWNNIAYLNTNGDLASSSALTAWNSIVGVANPNAVCTAAEACFNLNPIFINAGADNYHLTNGSPAINLGAAANPTGSGSAGQAAPTDDYDAVVRTPPPDAGAYEVPSGRQGLPTGTPTQTLLPTDTPTGTLTPPTETPLPTATNTPCIPTLRNPALCYTPTVNGTPTQTLTLGPAVTATPTQTDTPGPTLSPTNTLPPTDTPTVTQTLTPTQTLSPTVTNTPTQTATRTLTPTITNTPVVTARPTRVCSPSPCGG